MKIHKSVYTNITNTERYNQIKYVSHGNKILELP